MLLFLFIVFNFIDFNYSKEIELIRSSNPTIRGLLRKTNSTAFLLSNLNEKHLYYDIISGISTSATIYAQSNNEGHSSLLFFVNHKPKYLIYPGSSGSGLDFQDLTDNTITSYHNSSLVPPFNFTQYNDDFFGISYYASDLDVTNNYKLSYFFIMNIHTKDIIYYTMEESEDIYEKKIGSISNGLLITCFERYFTSTYSQLQINYYSIDFTQNTISSLVEMPIPLYFFVNYIDYVELDHNSNVLMCFTNKQADFISCFEIEYINTTPTNIYAKRFTPLGPIDEFQMAKIANELIIFGYTEGNYYNIFFLSTDYDDPNDYKYSSPITIAESIGHNEFIILSDFTIILVRSGNTDSNTYSYYAEVISFSFENLISNYVNPEHHYSFYFGDTEISQCNESCLTCINNQPLICASCGKENYEYLIEDTGICVHSCPEFSFPLDNNTCFFYFDSSDNIKNDILNVIENNVAFIANYGLLIQESTYSYEVKYYNQNEEMNNNDLSYVFLNECENLLKRNNNDQLIIVKYEEIDLQSIKPKVTYKIYNREGGLLDLSLCDSISISYPLINTTGLNYSRAEKMSLLGVDIYNIKDTFFNDLCFPYKEDNNDMILEDRINDIYTNVSFCEDNCLYQGVNFTSNRVMCQCGDNAQTKDDFVEDTRTSFFQKIIDATNIQIFKCWKVFFSWNNLKGNIGFYFGGGILFFQIIIVCIFAIRQENVSFYKILYKCQNDLMFITRQKLTSKKNQLLEEKEQNNSNNDEAIFKDAIISENRNFFGFFISLFTNKIELINIIFFRSDFELLTISFSLYLFSFLTDFTMNALLFSDDVISQKYHNKGNISFTTTLALTIISNILSYILTAILNRLTNFSPILEMFVEEISSKKNFYIKSKKIISIINMKLYMYFLLSFTISVVSVYYIAVFCGVNSGSQWSWFKDGLVSNLISIITLFVLCSLITLFRFVGLKCKSEKVYNVSLYLNK